MDSILPLHAFPLPPQTLVPHPATPPNSPVSVILPSPSPSISERLCNHVNIYAYRLAAGRLGGASAWILSTADAYVGVGSALRFTSKERRKICIGDRAVIEEAVKLGREAKVLAIRTIEHNYVEFLIGCYMAPPHFAYLYVPVEQATMGCWTCLRYTLTSRWLLDTIPHDPTPPSRLHRKGRPVDNPGRLVDASLQGASSKALECATRGAEGILSDEEDADEWSV